MRYKLLGIPLFVWGLQLLYVAVALLILLFLLTIYKKDLTFQVVSVLIVIVINIIWRLAIKVKY
jgi:hypothetical protein